MQGVVFTPENPQPQQGSPPPNNVIVTNMEEPLEPAPLSTKDSPIDQSNRSDSGIYSATANSSLDHDSDNRSDCSSPERKYVCSICNTMMTSQHNFTLHIRSHHNETTEDQSVNDKGFTCKICHKVLSSSSSLDRHVLVHSGERPFQCKYCGDTFTTNGNMHRHMRTHSNKGENYESDGSSDSGSAKSIEFNNNKVTTNKRKLEDEPQQGAASKRPTMDGVFRCPVCERSDFNTVDNLRGHLEDNHPEYPAKCSLCNQIFLNNKLLLDHKDTHHNSTLKHSVTGFDNLTFMDFSSKKFPFIARNECERNLHKPAGDLKFQCRRCSKAFPCSSSLDIHEKSCLEVLPHLGLNLYKGNRISEDEIRRAEFFSRLNLQDNSPEKKVPMPQYSLKERLAKVVVDTKDLADIQSILSNIHQFPAKNQDLGIHPPQKPLIDAEFKQQENNEEESQDSFAIEFRKMKQRGEFPCRLCTAVFPNLRALKGHNRAHLSGNTNGTYYCNMCPHSSIDKAALIRHMRTHNGDRPYECSLCNYAFTTKANCERHLRNRHSKTTREDVKKSIIYHPSEDPTNDELNKLTMRDDTKKHHSFSSSGGDSKDFSPEKHQVHCSTPKVTPKLSLRETEVAFPPPTLVPDLQSLKPSKLFPNLEFLREKALNEHNNRFLNATPFFAAPPFQLPTPESKIHVKPFEELKETSCTAPSEDDYYEEDEEEESPMEEALDLSKKKMDEDLQRMQEVEEPQDLSKKSRSSSPVPLRHTNIVNEFFAQELLKTPPHPAAALYATQLAHLCSNGFPGWPGFPVNPLIFQALPALQHTPQELKERMQRMCGGSMISEDFKNYMNLPPHPTLPQPQYQPPVENPTVFNDLKTSPPPSREPFPQPLRPKSVDECEEEVKPLSINVDSGFSHESITKMKHSDLMQSPNSVKMVIKNGVLMPKQKQRRYRTERPFTCEHCSAKFTLRSNMERHIKQQHPQFWSQRQRGTLGQPGRKPQGLLLKPNYCDGPYDLPKFQNYEESKERIHEKLRIALLSQMRPNHYQELKREEDDDCALVIDENDAGKSEVVGEDEEREPARERECARGAKSEEDLVPVSRLLVNASQQQFKEFFKRDGEEAEVGMVSGEEDEEGLVASGSTSEGNVSGTDENRSESEALNSSSTPVKKKSAYSLAPNRVSCPYCSRKFPWTSSLRRHILTHTGQKPFKCSHCPLLFTTKSNCDRHLLRKHGSSATTIVTSEACANNNMNYLMRNVPERPFKCSICPSSTFSTYSNLKKHMSCKHATNAQGDDIKAQGYEAGSSEDEKVNQEVKNDWENQIAYSKFATVGNNNPLEGHQGVPNSDLPFKCHLCESSFAERGQTLEHIRDKHASEYDLLMSKNAFDANATTPDETLHHDEEDSDIRGKFPDYSNRKVICAWCMRRFWSAEDLRRHMRTHTGERPFSCDICRRRFTLKHSMLRHRKKHAMNSGCEQDTTHSDEDGNGGVGEEAAKVRDRRGERTSEESDAQDGGGDLISNLLGLGDRSIVDKALDAPADDVAKLLGMRNGASSKD